MKEHDVIFHEKSGRIGAIVSPCDGRTDCVVEFLDGPLEALPLSELVPYRRQPNNCDHKPVEQPLSSEIVTADEVFIKSMCVRSAGTLIPQHAHKYAHTSALVAGAVRVWCDGELLGDFAAPKLLLIEAGTKHKFLSLSDNTVILCIHNAMRPDVAAVIDEHILER